jgi:preprotein translocase subunit YajC
VHTLLISLAQAATGAPAPQAQGPAGCAGAGGMQSIIFMVLMFAVFYFMLIRPQQKKAKEHQTFLSGLKKGDQVVTRGGVVGKVTGVTDTVVTLEVQEKVRIRVLKSYVDGQHRDAVPAAAKEKDKEPASTTAAT